MVQNQPPCPEFDFHNPGIPSWENDLYITGNCINSQLRLAIYTILIMSFSAPSLIGVYCLAKLKRGDVRILSGFVACSTAFMFAYVAFFMRWVPGVGPPLFCLGTIAGEFSITGVARAFFSSSQGTNSLIRSTSETSDLAVGKVRQMLDKLQGKLSHWMRVVFVAIVVVNVVAYTLVTVGVLVKDVSQGYILTTTGMTLSMFGNGFADLFVGYVVCKYGWVLSQVILETVNDVQSHRPESAINPTARPNHTKMQNIANEIKRAVTREIPMATANISLLNFVLGIWALATIGTVAGMANSFWVISAKCFFIAVGCGAGVNVYGLSPLRQKSSEATATSPKTRNSVIVEHS